MAMYSKRDTGYKVGMLIFCVGMIAFVTGFATPHWAKFQFRLRLPLSSAARVQQTEWKVEGYTGLWTYCFDLPAQVGESRCQDVPSSSPGWMTAVKVLDCTAVGVMGLALMFFFVTNCVTRKAAFTRLLEVGTGISGLLGAGGAGIYIWKSSTTDDLTDTVLDDPDLKKSLAWSFYINAGGTVIVLLATILIGAYNAPIKPKQAARPARPTAPFPTLGRQHAAPASVSEQGFTSSGTNPYVISTVMTENAPKLYPSLQDVNEGSQPE